MSKEVMQEVMTALDHLKELDKRQKELLAESREMARRARAGTLTERERRNAMSNPRVVDFGDVFEELKRLHPKVKRALKVMTNPPTARPAPDDIGLCLSAAEENT